MPQELQPKIRSRNPLQTQRRLHCQANGWSCVPCEGKSMLPKGWPTMPNGPEDIRRWDDARSGMRPFAGTGVRVEGLLCVLDIDVTHAGAVEGILRRLYQAHPDLRGALVRRSGGTKVALFFRVSKPIGMRRTARYGDGDVVEIFGSLVTRYFAIDGPHSVPGRFYAWDAGAPWGTRLDALPVIDAEASGGILDLCEEGMAEHLKRIPNSGRSESTAPVSYTLEPGQTFITTEGEEVELTVLEGMIVPGTEIRGLMSREDWNASVRKNHCKALVDHRGRLLIQDFDVGAQYRWKGDEPDKALELDEATRAELAALQGRADVAATPEAPPRDALDAIPTGATVEASFANAVNWLARNVAWYAGAYGGRGGAISIHPDAEFVQPVTIASLRGALMRFSYVRTGPRGGQQKQHPVDAWMSHPQQVRVYGARMRPDMAAPLYHDPDDGLRYINRYFPPRHPAGGGSVAAFEERMAALVPDAVERAWVMNWIACKVQRPEWRMIALAMIAREMGTGRGLLAETLALLMGRRFVAPMPYAKLSGGAGARFNAEVVNCVLVYINESRDADDRKFAHKNAAREAVKDFIEPNHRLPFRVEPKGVDAYTTVAAVSTLVFSNNIDGLPISEGDRRLAIVMNGLQMTVGERDAYQAWMADPANIGALYRHFMAWAVESDRSVFDPYMAPAFHGRDLMIDAGKTALDHAWEAAIAHMEKAANLYTMTQVVMLTRQFAHSYAGDFDSLVQKHTIVNGHRIGIKHSTNWLVTFQGERERVYAFNEAGRRRWSEAPRQDVIRELGVQQKAVDAPTKAFNKALSLVGGVSEDE